MMQLAKTTKNLRETAPCDRFVDRLKTYLDFNPETGVFTRKTSSGGRLAGSVAGTITKAGYTQITFQGRLYYAHRLAWLFVTGGWPENEIDHIDGRKSNNRIKNLRDATHAQNMHNQRDAQRSNKTSGLLGVYFSKGRNKWHAQIKVSGRRRHLGYFDCVEAAHAEYLAAKSTLHRFSDHAGGSK